MELAYKVQSCRKQPRLLMKIAQVDWGSEFLLRTTSKSFYSVSKSDHQIVALAKSVFALELLMLLWGTNVWLSSFVYFLLFVLPWLDGLWISVKQLLPMTLIRFFPNRTLYFILLASDSHLPTFTHDSRK